MIHMYATSICNTHIRDTRIRIRIQTWRNHRALRETGVADLSVSLALGTARAVHVQETLRI